MPPHVSLNKSYLQFNIYFPLALQKCRYKNHVYTTEPDGTHSVIIEWIPPTQNFEKINVYCPTSILTYEYNQVVSLMYTKCKVTDGMPYNVTFVTIKSGFQDAIYQFTDIAPLGMIELS